jgi:hypothetical protein
VQDADLALGVAMTDATGDRSKRHPRHQSDRDGRPTSTAGAKLLYVHPGGVPALNAYSYPFRNG